MIIREGKLMDSEIDTRHDGFPIEYMRKRVKDPSLLLVFMPAALPHQRPDPNRKYFSRWAWRDLWPQAEVISILDPSVLHDSRLTGGWFLHRQIDFTASISNLVQGILNEIGLPVSRTIFYGSSLGGFGGLMCASNLRGSHVIAEIPQIMVRNWHTVATKPIEQFILHEPLSAFEARHPERMDVFERFQINGFIPSFQVISNLGDRSIEDQLSLLERCRTSSMEVEGRQELHLLNAVEGHKVLPKLHAKQYIDAACNSLD